MSFEIIKRLASHQPLRFMAKSIRNVYFPSKSRIGIDKTIAIEVSSFCNARCLFCIYRLGYRTKTIMTVEAFKNIAQSAINAGYENLDLTSPSGELFIHRDAIKVIHTAKNAGFKHIGVFTNGISIYKHNIEDLLTSGVNVFLISFPGFDEAIYQEIFGVSKYHEFKKSIIELLETHRKINSNVIIIFEPRTYLKLNQLKQTKFYENHISNFISDKIVLREPLRVFDSWGGEIKQKDLIKGMRVDSNPIKSIYPLKRVFLCVRLLSIGVLANGDVRLCNCRFDSTIETDKDSLFIDNVKNYESFADLMTKNKDKIDKIKSAFIHGKLPALCKKCPFYMPVKSLSRY